jgi:pimeloyl-ACP methyl ester carboxylesterase
VVTLLLVQAASPTTREFTLAPGETIATTTFAGDSSTIVIVPGLLGSVYGFRQITPKLVERGHRVIIVDVLGAGASSKPAKADYSLTTQSRRVETVLDSLGARNALVVAQALGGSISYRLAAHRPDIVRAIVGIDAGAAEEASTSGLRKALKFAPLIRLFGARRTLVGRVREGLIEGSANPAWVTNDVVNEYTAPYRQDAGHMLRVLQAIAASKEPEQLEPLLPAIAAPVLLLVGDHPSALAPEKIELLRSRLPNFTLQRVENAGQHPHEERPDVVVEAVLRAVK